MNRDTAIAVLGAKILYLGEDDWVSIGEAWRYAGYFVEGDPDQLELALSAIERLTARGLVEPGAIRGSRFEPWPGTVAQKMSLMREACTPDPDHPWWWEDACWLNNTTAGSAHEALLPAPTKTWLSREEVLVAMATIHPDDGLAG